MVQKRPLFLSEMHRHILKGYPGLKTTREFLKINCITFCKALEMGLLNKASSVTVQGKSVIFQPQFPVCKMGINDSSLKVSI